MLKKFKNKAQVNYKTHCKIVTCVFYLSWSIWNKVSFIEVLPKHTGKFWDQINDYIPLNFIISITN